MIQSRRAGKLATGGAPGYSRALASTEKWTRRKRSRGDQEGGPCQGVFSGKVCTVIMRLGPSEVCSRKKVSEKGSWLHSKAQKTPPFSQAGSGKGPDYCKGGVGGKSEDRL